MAKSHFTHACGHQGSVVGRNRADADRQERYYTQQDCWDCEKAARSTAAAEAAQAQALPTLTGSAKQIAWAEQLRQAALGEMAHSRTQILNGLDGRCSEAAASEVADALSLLENELRCMTSAHTWIDERGILGTLHWVKRQVETRHLCPTLETEEWARRVARHTSQ